MGSPKVSLVCPFQYLNDKGEDCVLSILVPVPGSRLQITTLSRGGAYLMFEPF